MNVIFTEYPAGSIALFGYFPDFYGLRVQHVFRMEDGVVQVYANKDCEIYIPNAVYPFLFFWDLPSGKYMPSYCPLFC